MSARVAVVAVTLALVISGCATTGQRPADLTRLGVGDAARLIREKKERRQH